MPSAVQASGDIQKLRADAEKRTVDIEQIIKPDGGFVGGYTSVVVGALGRMWKRQQSGSMMRR